MELHLLKSTLLWYCIFCMVSVKNTAIIRVKEIGPDKLTKNKEIGSVILFSSEKDINLATGKSRMKISRKHVN